MKVLACLTRIGALAITGSFAMILAAPAHAQATRTWVSGVGDDANPCSRTAPCKTFAGAISKTATNGEINCLDPGGFGAVTITKSISIICDHTQGAIAAAGTPSAILINATANSIVTIKGVNIECAATGQNGVRVIGSGAIVHLHKLQIRNCRGGGSGINIEPSSGETDVYVADSYITANGTSSTQAGIRVRPTGSGSANLTVDRTQLENNSNGVIADSSATVGSIRGSVRDSMIGGGSFTGVAAITSPSSQSIVMVDRSSVFNNGTGLSTSGAGAALVVSHTTVRANGTGLSALSGYMYTYGNNAVSGNGVDGAFNANVALQ